MSDARVSLPPDVRRMNATADLVYGALTLVVLGAGDDYEKFRGVSEIKGMLTARQAV